MIISPDSDILHDTSRELVIIEYLESIRSQIVPLWEIRQLPGKVGYGQVSRTLVLDYKEANHVYFSKYFITGLYGCPENLLRSIKDLLVEYVLNNKEVKEIKLENFHLRIFSEEF